MSLCGRGVADYCSVVFGYVEYLCCVFLVFVVLLVRNMLVSCPRSLFKFLLDGWFGVFDEWLISFGSSAFFSKLLLENTVNVHLSSLMSSFMSWLMYVHPAVYIHSRPFALTNPCSK